MIMMKIKVSWSLFAALIFILVFVATKLEYEHLKIESQWRSTTPKRRRSWSSLLNNNNKGGGDGDGDFWSLPQGIVHSTSDLELRPLWTTSKPSFYSATINSTALLAIPVGLNQKTNVDHMVNKFLSANCSILLFHYDGNVDAWNDLHWSTKAVHVLAHNQTKWTWTERIKFLRNVISRSCDLNETRKSHRPLSLSTFYGWFKCYTGTYHLALWFAKRFLHPDVVFIYDYIFLWDEDLGVTNFDPGRFLEIMASEGLEISQPALDPDLSEVHHRITIRNRREKFHRRVYAVQGSLNCSEESTGPPCTGWIEGMAPVFSRAAWRCVWHLIQNDLIHGWGLDMKLGYCAQGDRTEKVGVIDSEYVVHHGIPSLGGPSENKTTAVRSLDLRTHVRRQSAAELEVFQKRWDQAVREDEGWDDPFDNMK